MAAKYTFTSKQLVTTCQLICFDFGALHLFHRKSEETSQFEMTPYVGCDSHCPASYLGGVTENTQ